MEGPRTPDIEEFLAGLHDEARGRLKEELLPGERLLWAARRHRDPVRPYGYMLASLFLLASVVATVASFSHASRPAWSRDDDVHGIVVLGIANGLISVFTAIWMASSLNGARNRRRTWAHNLYALTDRRLIMRSPTPDYRGIEIRAFDLPLICNIHRVEYPDGLGTVAFRVATGHRVRVDLEHGGVKQDDSYTLERIPEARRIELLLRQAVADAKDTPSLAERAWPAD